jgi:hypothetical protein
LGGLAHPLCRLSLSAGEASQARVTEPSRGRGWSRWRRGSGGRVGADNDGAHAGGVPSCCDLNLQGRERLRAPGDVATALALPRADRARRADVAGGRVRRLPLRPAASRADLTVWRPAGASRVSSRTQTSTTRCAAAGRRAQVLGSCGGVGRAATGTPNGRPPRGRLQSLPPARP